jgi:hypothetical protein
MASASALTALDIVVGLVFIFLLMSIVCSAVNEAVASVLGWRAKTLEDAIRNVLGDPEVKRGWKEWFGRVQKKGLRGDVAQHVEVAGGDEAPDESRTVSLPGDLASRVLDHWPVAALVRNPGSDLRRRRRPSYLPPRAFSLAVAETLAMGAPQSGDERSVWRHADQELFDRVQTVLRHVPPGQVRAVLQKAAANADGELEQFRGHLETAFDDSMERASGWYKRKVQVMLVVLAATVAIGLNVDTVHVATRLWSDQPTRTAVAAKAVEQSTSAQEAADTSEQVRQLQLPIGWGAGNAPQGLGGTLRRIPGWLITVAALSLGAPFWFDLLSRLARLRGSGVPERPRSLSDTAGTVRPRG